jgi:hypothetical protein
MKFVCNIGSLGFQIFSEILNKDAWQPSLVLLYCL